MATNLLISYPQVFRDAGSIEYSGTTETNFGIENIIGGQRHNYFKQSGTGATDIDIDSGPGNTFDFDHIFIARADLLSTFGTTEVIVRSGASFAGLTDRMTISPISPLGGTRNEDLYEVPGSTFSGDRVIRISFTTPAGSAHTSQIGLGELFDFGVDPHDWSVRRISKPRQDRYLTDVGNEQHTSLSVTRDEFSFTWRGVTDAKVNQFEQEFADQRHKFPCFLYTDGKYDEILADRRILHCSMTSYDAQKVWVDYNEVRATFEELVG